MRNEALRRGLTSLFFNKFFQKKEKARQKPNKVLSIYFCYENIDGVNVLNIHSVK